MMRQPNIAQEHSALRQYGSHGNCRATVLDAREPGSVLVPVEDAGAGLSRRRATNLRALLHDKVWGPLGIGLSICRSIIEAHGGRPWASPRAPYGTAFCFIVPTARSSR